MCVCPSHSAAYYGGSFLSFKSFFSLFLLHISFEVMSDADNRITQRCAY